MIARAAFRFRFAMIGSPSLVLAHCDSRLNIRPATVVTKVPSRFSRTVIDDGLNDVFTGFAESGDCGSFAVDGRSLGRIESNIPGTSVFHPHYCHAQRLPGSLGQSIIGGGDVQ